MLKPVLRYVAVLLLAGCAGMQLGCRACSNCHDYSSPVANCECQYCDGCGGGRAGSACMKGGCTTGGCPSGDCYAGSEGDPIEQAIEFAEQPTGTQRR